MGPDTALQVTQLAHALVGVVEAHATRAEDAYRAAGAGPADLVQASLMAFAGMTSAAHVAVNPRRGDEDAAIARETLSKAMGALEEAAKDIHTHRAIGDLIRLIDGA